MRISFVDMCRQFVSNCTVRIREHQYSLWDADNLARTDLQGKLELYLPTATDSVLCDYVLVMVGNKKTRLQIANDLEVAALFLFRRPIARYMIEAANKHRFSDALRADDFSGIPRRPREQRVFSLALGAAEMCRNKATLR